MGDLPTSFDVIVVGTGLAESIVSAAVSRNGHSCLHLDPRDYYGDKWTTINWESLASGGFHKNPSGGDENEIDYGDFVWTNPIRGIEQLWYVKDGRRQEEIGKLSRKFNIDVLPKLLLAREPMIELLISSNVSRYLEFKCVNRLFASMPPPQQTVIEPIPLSRSDIFTTKSLGLVEKRKLTKFIEAVLLGSNETQPTSSSTEPVEGEPSNPPQPKKTFTELVEATNISEKIQHLIKSAVKTVEDEFEDNFNSFNEQFVERCKLYLHSIGRYQNQTPYLWTLYGVGEICQAFCRLSAIYGGIFILKRTVQAISACSTEEDADKVVVKSDDAELKAKYLVLGSELRHKEDKFHSNSRKTLVRAILLIYGGMLKKENEQPSGAGDSRNVNQMAVYKIGNAEVVELDQGSLAVPPPYRLIQVTCPLKDDNSSPRTIIESILGPYFDFTGRVATTPTTGQENPDTSGGEVHNNEDGLEDTSSPGNVEEAPAVTNEAPMEIQLSSDDKPVVVHGSYFLLDFHDQSVYNGTEQTRETPRNKIFYCASSSTEITGEIERARQIFQKMYPQEEFLPKASDGTGEDEDNAEETEHRNETLTSRENQTADDNDDDDEGVADSNNAMDSSS